ncbi:RE2 [Symbiodinium sp. CCMP2592]|nr:RE2 [Symbiodinium sp. CCMP2592]
MYTKGGGNYSEWKDIDPWVTPPAPAATMAAPAAAPLKERGIKMSSVIDQSDDSEFVPESLAKADSWYQRYLRIMGGAPQEEEDCTVEQLSALNKRVHTLDLPPYVDLGVWQPYGRRALRASKFRAWFPDGAGGYMARELPGPASWSQWLAAWRVFQTAAIMLDILPLASLQLYVRHIEKLVKLYPSAWHLVVLADEKARGEKWARLRLKISADLAAGKGPPELWDPHRPWVSALHLLVNDTAFWEDQVRSPANAWVASGGRGAPRTPEETYSASQASGSDLDPSTAIRKRTSKEKRQAKKQRVQAEKEELKVLRAAATGKGKLDGKGDKGGGLKFKDQAGSDLCFSWDSAKGPWMQGENQEDPQVQDLLEPRPPQPGLSTESVSLESSSARSSGSSQRVSRMSMSRGQEFLLGALWHDRKEWSPEGRGGSHMGQAAGCCVMAGKVFCFLHLFSGSHDKLGEAVVAEARAPGLEATVEAYDLCKGHDLTNTGLVQTIVKKAREGKYQAGHAGFPCTTFTRLRWRPEQGQPGPVRSRRFIYGLPGNNRAQQEEADRGTLLALTSLKVLDAMAAGQLEGEGEQVRTIENPPETGHAFAGSAYYLPEVVEWISRPGVEFADFNNCVYADPAKGEQAYRKPQRFVGVCPGLSELTAKCRCGPSFFHPKVVGTMAAKDSASYPMALCKAYAKLVVRAWIGKAEGGIKRPSGWVDRPPAGLVEEAQWEGGQGTFGSLRVQDSKKARRDKENKEAIGGMRRPVWALEHVPGLRAVGLEVSELFDKFAAKHPGAKGAAQDYGTEGFEIGFVEEWRRWLENHFGVESGHPRLQLKSLLHYESPVNTSLLEAWTLKARDPDKAVVDWLKEADGTVKRRVIVDALRSGANARARCPERIVLPRPQDIYTMAADLKAHEPQLLEWYRAERIPTKEWGSELVAADLTDAFTHFPVHPSEHEQCLSPAGDGENFYVFVAMFFGHKCAPLIMCGAPAGDLYIDDPLTALVGSRARRNRNLSLELLTLGALGIRLAWHKGARGCKITWIGIHFSLRWREGILDNEVPEKLRDELLEKLEKWAKGGMVPLSQLRTFAGKLTWAAGIYKRARWAVSIVYGAITAHEAEVRDGTEEARRAARQDGRSKEFLVPVKRFELARAWLATLFKTRRPKTSMSLWRKPESIMIVTDASPQGCGGMLLVRANPNTPWNILKAFEYPIEPQDATLLGFVYKSHRSQSYLEALAVYIALLEWGSLLAAIKVGLAIRSDSTVALALLEKAASSSAALNLLAAEMALHLEKLQVGEIALSHVPGNINVLSDWLSRPETRGDMPSQLQGVKIGKPKKLNRPRLDSMHFPSRSDVVRTATSDVGAAPSSADGKLVVDLLPQKSSARTSAARSGCPVPGANKKVALCSGAGSESAAPPGPLSELQLRRGPTMLRWQRQGFSDSHAEAFFEKSVGGPQHGPSMGSRPKHGEQTGGFNSSWGPGLWSHLGPSVYAALPPHGETGGHRRQPDVKDLALRSLSEDRRPRQSRTALRSSESQELRGPNKGAKFRRALEVARDPSALAAALADLKNKFFAESNQAAQARKETDVLELVAALTKGLPAFPLTPTRVLEFGAALLEAKYKSGEQYLGALRLAHVERDHAVTPALKRAFDLAKRALARDKGTADRAPEYQIEDFPMEAVIHDLVPGELALPKLTYGLAVSFMLRRCELERVRWKDVTWDNAKLTLFLRKSKTDQAGKGVRRTLGCTCARSAATCPVELVKELAKAVRAGLTIAEVTYLGRWHSDLVFQYGEEAWEEPEGRRAKALPAPPSTDSVAHLARELPEDNLKVETQEGFSDSLLTGKPKWVTASGRSKAAAILKALRRPGKRNAVGAGPVKTGTLGGAVSKEALGLGASGLAVGVGGAARTRAGFAFALFGLGCGCSAPVFAWGGGALAYERAALFDLSRDEPAADPVVEALRGEVAGLLESQAQQLQAAIGELAAQRQQQQGLAAAAATAAPAPAPAQASGGGHLLKSMRLPTSLKGRDDWERFAFQAESYLAVVDTRYPAELEVARKCKVPLQMAAMTEEVRTLSVRLFGMLGSWTQDSATAVKLARGVGPDGFELWRLLWQEHNPENESKNLTWRRTLLMPKFPPKESDFSLALQEWEADLDRYTSEYGAGRALADEDLRAVLVTESPNALRQHLAMHAASLSTYAEVREVVVSYLQAKRVWTPSAGYAAASRRDPNAMDIGRIGDRDGKDGKGKGDKGKKGDKDHKKGKGDHNDKGKGKGDKKGNQQGCRDGKERCPICWKTGHTVRECWFNAKGKGKGNKGQVAQVADDAATTLSTTSLATAGPSASQAGSTGGSGGKGQVRQVHDDRILGVRFAPPHDTEPEEDKILKVSGSLLVDSGACVSVCRPEAFPDLQPAGPPKSLYSLHNSRLKTKGRVQPPVRAFGSTERTATFCGQTACEPRSSRQRGSQFLLPYEWELPPGSANRVAPVAAEPPSPGRDLGHYDYIPEHDLKARKVEDAAMEAAADEEAEAAEEEEVAGNPAPLEEQADQPESRPRGLRAPRNPTEQERAEHELTHTPYQAWCEKCVEGKAREDPHRRREPSDDPVTPLVTMEPHRQGLVEQFVDRLGYDKFTLQVDQENAIASVARAVHRRLGAARVRTWLSQLRADYPALEHVAWLQARFGTKSTDGVTPYRAATGTDYGGAPCSFGETVLAKLPRPGNKAQVRWVKGVWAGNVRSVRRLPPETRHQTAVVLKACGLPWNPRFGRAAPAERSEPMMVPIPLATPAEEVERLEPPGEPWLFHDGPRSDDEALLVAGAEQTSRLPDASPTEELANADVPDYEPSDVEAEPAAASALPQQAASPAQAANDGSGEGGQKRDSAGSSASAAAAQQPPAAKSRVEPKKAPQLGVLTEREVWQHIAALADPPLTNHKGERDAWVGQVTDLLDRMLDPKEVEQARKEQLRKLWDRGAFTPVLRSEVPRGAQLFRAKWVDKCDKGRYKSRCTCADVKARYSPEQEAGLDVFVPTPTPESHSLLEGAALHNEGWVTRSLDIVAAFLIGKDRGAAEGRPVYMHAPVEWRELFDQWVLEQPAKDQQWYRDHFRDFVFRVDGNLYGRRTAGSVYRDELEEVLTGKLCQDYDFQRGVKDACVFLDRRSGLILLHHIDDIRVVGPKAAVPKFTEVDLPKHCEITVGELEEKGTAVEVLGRTKVRTEDSILTLPDSKHAENVCEQLGIGPKDKGTVPSRPLDLTKVEELSAGDAARFRSAAGSAIYLSADRRDIQFAVKELARRMQNPRVCDWLAAETLARYLRATPRFGRVVVLDPASKSTALLNLEVYSDSDWAGCPETRRSTDNIVACLGAAVIQTSCQTQPGLPATSSGDAEIRGVSRAAKEAVFLRELADCRGFGLTPQLRSEPPSA